MKLLMTRGGRGIIAAAVIALSFVGSSFVSENAHAALATAPYTTAELNAKLYGGVQQAIDWDKLCYDGVREERDAGHPPRQSINSAPSYRGLQWMSLADTPTQNNSSRTAPIVVDYGTTSVPLQLNIVKFLCAGLVSPDGAGADYAYTDPRVVRFLNDANDRDPNPMGGNTNWPALTDTRFRIDGIQVAQGDGHITGTAQGQYIGTARQENTRYWFANPVGFNFVSNSPSGLTADTEVKVKFTLRGYNTYYYNTYQCYENGNVYQSDPFNINKCDQNEITLSIFINIRFIYNLTPSASLGGQTSIEPGGTANVSNVVTKAANGTDSDTTDWRLTEMDFAPGTTLSAADLAARDSGSDPCGAFTAGGRSVCNAVQSDPSAIFKNASTPFTPGFVYTAPGGLAPGTKICFTASVSKPSQSAAPVWRHSSLECMVVAKKPKVQFWGGDVRVGGNIETSISNVGSNPSKMFGSWVEYGAFAVEANTGFASGSGYNNGTTEITDQLNKLTFANIDNSGGNNYGHFALPKPLSSIADQFMSTQSAGAPSGNLGSMASGTYKTTDLTINASTVGQDAANKGKSIIVIASGTVKIQGDINYQGVGGSDTFTRLDQLPQVVIIANKIDIAGSVGQINAWLLTTGDGAINTCSDRAPSVNLNAGVCNNKLTINGPVSTQHLYLRRTAGAGSDAGDPAELFNLRPDAFMWAYMRSSENGKAQTVYSIELPPRF